MSKNPIAKEITQYISDINEIYKVGNATEHSYRSALKTLWEEMIVRAKNFLPLQDMTITNEPKRIDCGAPDYIVIQNEIPVGYIEAKNIDTDLNHKTHKEQFDRYKHSLDNLIITDYLTFQLFVNGDFITSVTIAKTGKNGITGDKTQFDAFATLIDSFIGYEGQPVKTSLQLSKIMAAKARLLSKTIENVLDEETNTFKMECNDDSSLLGQLKAFKDVMQHDMSHKQFADVYAQTIAYGMFAAKFNDKSNTTFNRNKAAQLIPQSNPFLRNLFQVTVGFDVDKRICWVVDDLANLFNYVNIDDISKEFDKIDNDAMIHFYETFLAEYDPTLRKSRGVWYTPQPVVKFIVQAVDGILKKEFGINKGLANNEKIPVVQKNELNKDVSREYHRVQILDPATGTGTFLSEVVQHIFRSNKEEKGMWDSFVSKDLIPRINGFEILMASYAMAHLKLDLLLQKTGYIPTKEDRLRIYLTNSLEEPRAGSGAQFAQWLSNEANEASRIKRDLPIMVVLGNPPYSGESQNKSNNKKVRSWIERLLDDYKKEPINENETIGRKLKEKNAKWINDDYVKFIRFGQYFIEKNEAGVLAFVTNHSFLDNPTFRGMRWNLLKTFDKIYILDLHGNAKKKEIAPDGDKDENVFDIQQGVSINIFVKKNNDKNFAQVFHYDLYGKRIDKYNFLLNNTLETVPWTELDLSEPQFFFVNKDFSQKEEYEKGFSIADLFSEYGVGITTAHDEFVIDEKDVLKIRFEKFKSAQPIPDELHTKFNVKKKEGWNIHDGWLNIQKSSNLYDYIKPISYRPFDNRYIFYEDKLVWRCVRKIMRHFINGNNVGLMLCRQQKTNGFYHCLVHNNIVESSFVSNKTSEIGYSFPLYLHPEIKNQTSPDYGLGKPNLNPELVKVFAEKIGVQFTPLTLFDYIYAVLHSPTYRERYKEFLKIDFPRIPYPENVEQFLALSALGEKLRLLHLMENVEPREGMATYPQGGTHIIEKLKYENEKVYINDAQYFDNVPSVAWNFYIGGYQPAQKWLKDRKGKKLDSEDVRHYRKIIRVLVETEEVMREIDKISNG